MQNKKELRKDFHRVLTNLDERWLEAAAHSIGRELSKTIKEGIPQEIEHVLCFAAFFPGEVDLTNFISEQIELRKVYLPILHQDGKMTFISIESNWQEASSAGSYGISEPSPDTGTPFLPEHASAAAMLVPGIAFDKTGNRLGRGKGYYDRFLANKKYRELTKIGVCWEMQIIEEVPSESHDISMDWICHERGSIKTGALFED